MLRPAHRFLLALLGIVAAVLLSGCQATTSATPQTSSTAATVAPISISSTSSTITPLVTTTTPPTTTSTRVAVVTTKAKPKAKTTHPATSTHKPSSPKACGSGYYRNSKGVCVHRPVPGSSAPPGATAKCKDGTYSFSKHRSGTCSGHHGVAQWL